MTPRCFTDLSPEMVRQGTAVARLELVEPSPAVATQRLVAGYALREQQSCDPVDMHDALFNQGLALAAKPAAVLFLNGRRLDHRTHPRFAALVGPTRAKQRLPGDPRGLG